MATNMQDTTPTPGAASASTGRRGYGNCHGCHNYHVALRERTDGRWICPTCEDEADHIAAGGTVEWVPCPECANPRRTWTSTRQRCPVCEGVRKVKRLVPAVPPTPYQAAESFYDGQGACLATRLRVGRERLTAAQCATMTADLAAMGRPT